MKSTLGRIILFIILVLIVVAMISAIQDPQIWRRDWHATRDFSTQKWQALQHWLAPHERPSMVSQPLTSAAPTKPVEPTAPPPVVRAAFPKNLTQSQYTLLMAARAAFWQHDVAAAIADYRALIREQSHIPQLYGELGNIYFQTGHPLSAGEAYAEAANRLIAEHHYPAAAALLPLIGSLNPHQVPLIREALAR